MCRLHWFSSLGPAVRGVVLVVEDGSGNGGEGSSSDHSRLSNYLLSIYSV